MKLKQGLAIAVAALGVLALPASGAVAQEDVPMTHLNFCEGHVHEAGDCAAAVVPSDQWPEAGQAINDCLGQVQWTADDVEACALKWDPSIQVIRFHETADGELIYGGGNFKKHQKHHRHHGAGKKAGARG